jgi:hypothetical protein
MAKKEHSAIPSWSGYVYQGKVAVYHVLKIIKDNLSANQNTTFGNYDLEIEWQEDFSILINGKYDSIHQVKAYEQSSSPTVYNKALTDLFDKLSRGIGVSGWLNIWNPINFTPGTDSKDFSELKIANQTTSKQSYLQSVLDQVEIYTYCNGNQFCDLDEIDKLIVKKIKEIYTQKNFGIPSQTDKQYEIVRFELYQIIDNHIIEVHKDPTKKKKTIPFNTILDKFAVNYEEYGKEYEYIKVKNNFFEKIFEYCDNSENCDIDTGSCNDDCSLFVMEKELERKSAEEVYKIILRSTPHYQSINDLMKNEGLIFGLIRSFHSLNKDYQTSQYLYKKNDTYLPTTIHEKRNKAIIAKKILENKELDSILDQFEANIFISDDVSSLDIIQDARLSKKVGGQQIDDLFGVTRRNAIDKIQQIQIKPLDDVKGDLG